MTNNVPVNVPADIQISTARQRELFDNLKELVAARSAAEAQLDAEQSERSRESGATFREERDEMTRAFELEIGGLRGDYKQLREEAISKFENESFSLVQEHDTFVKDNTQTFEDEMEKAKRRYEVTRTKATEEFDEKKEIPKQKLAQFEKRCDVNRSELQKLNEQAERILRRRGITETPESPQSTLTPGEGLLQEEFATTFAKARTELRTLERRPASMYLESGWPFLIFLFALLGSAYPCIRYFGWGLGLGVCFGGSVVLAVAVWVMVRPFSKKQTLRALPNFQQQISDGNKLVDAALQNAKDDAEQRSMKLFERRESVIGAAHAEWSRSRSVLTQEHETAIKEATEKTTVRRQQIKVEHDETLKRLDTEYLPQIEEREKKFTEDSERLSERRQGELAVLKAEFDEQWSDLVDRWEAGMADFQSGVGEMVDFCGHRFPVWDSVDWSTWQPTQDELPGLRFGSYKFHLDELEDGVPKNERLQVEQTEYDVPAVLSYPGCPSLLYLAEDEGRDAATASLQNVMLRLLVSLPPGKVRFTIIDPTGLGQNFSAFMHLADFDERLVSNRIWTESNHINKQLVDLTEHMENVIQKYLRNEFESIQEYNRDAGEVAEPFQILVAANFPANFSDEAARRLVSIAASGARCGVYTLISVDNKMKLPRNFDLADLQTQAETLKWNGERFLWTHDDLQHLTLELDSPPNDDQFTAAVRAAGDFAKDANRVEVPFASVAAKGEQWWSLDSRSEIEVPLGRAGATKLQYMRLGKGTSQHVLISGKTGSGKSTLLHALITNLATYYSPEEIQFYLIDFKKGVEFKAYAALGLPHARVIAIESEREFGMSVLERLDLELKQRGDLFRQEGVQDLRGYRDANPDVMMPRILLIIDEFQEFFVKDDRIAQEAGLLMDRLVRQGRAFGIHVLLGSQTLAGAYSLARSTLGQMAVRVALQCSEGDAHLILSDDNTAARLLSRPGEAIYNDANGMFEGNHPFQVVWLPDSEKENYLQQVADLAKEREVRTPPPIVFEGNVPAAPEENDLLRKALSVSEPGSLLAPRAWLGAAVAIKDPAAAVFRRQSGSNLLMVGQQEELSLGVLANCVISLAADVHAGKAGAQSEESGDAAEGPEDKPKFYVLDGERLESPTAGFWKRLDKRLPFDLEIAAPRKANDVVAEIAAEVDRRLDGGLDTASPIFLVIYNLSRFRDLRKSEDFSFSMDDDDKPSADKQLATILREGPNFGVHTLIWSDNYNNVNRWLERQTMNDLEMRVLFQMSQTDSSNLMESPEASRLGANRAILYHEEQGEYEKFRPYGLPEDEWLDWVKEQLGSRVADAVSV